MEAHEIEALQVIIEKYGIYMQQLANLAEDNSYPGKSGQKSMYFINGLFEFGSATKMLSKTYISQTKKQLKRNEDKDFKSLPTVRRFLNNVKEEKGKELFQDVKLKGFDNAKAILSRKCVAWVSEKCNIRETRKQRNHCIKILCINSK